MTITKVQVLWASCDGGGCDVAVVEEPPKRELEAALRRRGWKLGVDGMFCPDCAGSS